MLIGVKNAAFRDRLMEVIMPARQSALPYFQGRHHAAFGNDIAALRNAFLEVDQGVRGNPDGGFEEQDAGRAIIGKVGYSRMTVTSFFEQPLAGGRPASVPVRDTPLLPRPR